MTSVRVPWTKRAKRRLWALWTNARPETPPPSATDLSLAELASLFAWEATAPDRPTAQFGGIDGLLAHLAQRPSSSWPAFPWYMAAAIPGTADEVITASERILAGRIIVDDKYEFRFDGEIDWHRSLSDDPRGRPTRALNRHYWWMVPARAYQQTGDERYAAYLDRVIRSWVTSVPRPQTKDESSTTWALMEAGIRCQIWPAIFGLLQHSDSFTSEGRIAMLRSLYDHAQFLAAFHNNTNHLLRESNGLANVARSLPEFREAESWWTVATGRLHEALRTHVNDDGSYFEVSTGYQLLALEEFDYAIDLLEERGDPRLGEFRGRVLDMYRTAAALSRPDGALPLINDGYPAQRWTDMFEHAVARFDAADLEFIAARGARGIAPETTSVHVPNAGWVVMRTGWGEDASYLLFDMGAYGGQHGHEDKLSIEVFAHGASFIVDPGCYTYDESDPFRHHFMSSRAHSTLVPAGLSQIRRWYPENRKARLSTGPHGEWTSNAVFDYAASAYRDGYAEFALSAPDDVAIASGVIHRRHVLHVRPDYWLLLDEMTAEYPVDVELHFQAGAGVSVEGDDGTTHLRVASGASLAMSLDRDDGELSVYEGAEDPIRGWDSSAWWEKTPAPALVWRWAGLDRLRVATLLEPRHPGAETPPRTVASVSLDRGRGAAWEVGGESSRDLIILGDDRERRSVLGHDSDARVTVIRLFGSRSRRADW